MSLFDRLLSNRTSSAGSSSSRPAKGPLLKPDGSPYELALYAYDGCPFCQRVYRSLDQLGIEVELRNTMRDRQHRSDLVAATGRGTVPCLFIDGNPMHESADIVRWLSARKAEQPA
ncbi:MAG: glutathione S-transferase N-terminal domain-containing protein [Deltaproteobacteria bacterium]|nr:glutathione S-transferase N-terminal domain-containing protein [Deltaproteobacteria bacterium]